MIDTHCHLDDDKLYPNHEQIIQEFDKYNIEKVIDSGSSYESSKRAVEIASKYDKVFATVGVHPEEVACYNNEVEDFIIKSASNQKVVAIGEIGLDYYYEDENSPRDKQKGIFCTQIELANYLKLPMVIHLREAYEDMYNILKENKSKLGYGLVLHCYSGSREMLREYNKFDAFYSFGGAITFKNYTKYDMLRAVPIDRIMLETDSPYLTPVPFRGKINTPLNVGFVAKKLAEVREKTEEEIISITTNNAKTIYGRLK